MLRAVFFLLSSVVIGTRYCYEASPRPSWLAFIPCTDNCLTDDTAHLDGVCADNIKGICELDGGVASYFRVFTPCLAQYCQTEDERMSFVTGFRDECQFYYSLNDTQANMFGTWKKYFVEGPTVDENGQVTVPERSSSTPTATLTLIGQLTSTSTTTRVESGSVVDVSTTVYPSPTSLLISSTSTVTSDSQTSVSLDNEVSSVTRTPVTITISVSAHISTSSDQAIDQTEQSVLSTSAVAGVAVGGTCLVALSVVAIFLILRRRRRAKPEEPRSMTPPIYEPKDGKDAYGQTIGEQQYSGDGVGALVGCAELDADSPVSPVIEPVYLSMSTRRARVAQNF